ncbi:hypothetical protein OH492_14415 [Vibrio chagasii]|nr:hypothetical protein [Vibrio chagasii]
MHITPHFKAHFEPIAYQICFVDSLKVRRIETKLKGDIMIKSKLKALVLASKYLTSSNHWRRKTTIPISRRSIMTADTVQTSIGER